MPPKMQYGRKGVIQAAVRVVDEAGIKAPAKSTGMSST